MKKEFVTYEQSLSLKELRFEEPCLFHILGGEINFYRSTQDYFPKNDRNGIGCSAILYQQAFRWFREKHNLCGEVYTVNMGAIDYTFLIRDLYNEDVKYNNFEVYTGGYSGTFNTYEESEGACLDKLIEIIKNKQD
jgi:hypothetical protein